MKVVLDTNVLVYAFVFPKYVPRIRSRDWGSLHSKAALLYENVLSGRHSLVIPSIVLVEMATVLSGMIGQKVARLDVENVKSVANIVYDYPLFTNQAIDYGSTLNLSGFDTKIATCSIIYSANLITNDKKFHDKFAPRAKEYGIKVYLLREMAIKQIRTLR